MKHIYNPPRLNKNEKEFHTIEGGTLIYKPPRLNKNSFITYQ